MNFAGKKGLCQFLNIPIIHDGAKNQKKLTIIPEKNAELTDRQTDNSDFTGLSVGLGIFSKKSNLENNRVVKF